MTIEVPQYSQALCRSKVDVMNFQGSTASYGYNAGPTSSNTCGYVAFTLPAASVVGITPQAGYSLHNIHRALADDGGFSCFVSVPPMVFNTTAAATRGFY